MVPVAQNGPVNADALQSHENPAYFSTHFTAILTQASVGAAVSRATRADARSDPGLVLQDPELSHLAVKTECTP